WWLQSQFPSVSRQSLAGCKGIIRFDIYQVLFYFFYIYFQPCNFKKQPLFLPERVANVGRICHPPKKFFAFFNNVYNVLKNKYYKSHQ
ncbi:hypothetical protein, partial [Mucilaginibacter sp. dw_454]|uniref:hypothetical protein n=1 Tax=Mucilaginibacter sp. dw_454 TaxID=2720079 RepID=UPI001BD20D46